MSSRRFELLLKFLHLNDSRKQPARGQPGYDKLYKVRPLLDVKDFQSCYSPTENLSIDESMVGFKGRLAFLQYMPKKPQKWGMKAWVLADASKGYVWNWRLYTGNDVNTPESPLGLAHHVVRICSTMTGCGTRVTASSWTTFTQVLTSSETCRRRGLKHAVPKDPT